MKNWDGKACQNRFIFCISNQGNTERPNPIKSS